MINAANIVSEKEKKNTDEVKEYKIFDYNAIKHIDSDNSSEHIYFDIQSIEGEKLD